MARWQPDARGRLEQAAMELYGERGFDQTTAAEIAERAGLTERTFFRYFNDKREVLFGGSELVKDLIVEAVAGAPESAPPLEAVRAGLTAFATVLEEQRGREFARRRQRIITSNDELRERELIKLATWGAALAGALRGRGVDESTANLAGEVGIAVFRVAFERWVDDGNRQDLQQLLHDSLDELKALSVNGKPTTDRRPRRAGSGATARPGAGRSRSS